MIRNIIPRGTIDQISSFRYLYKRKSDSTKSNKFLDGNVVAHEIEHYYKQDRELLEVLKRKTQDEVKNMQNEIESMRTKIAEYNRDINENLRYLKGLEKDATMGNKKE